MGWWWFVRWLTTIVAHLVHIQYCTYIHACVYGWMVKIREGSPSGQLLNTQRFSISFLFWLPPEWFSWAQAILWLLLIINEEKSKMRAVYSVFPRYFWFDQRSLYAYQIQTEDGKKGQLHVHEMCVCVQQSFIFIQLETTSGCVCAFTFILFLICFGCFVRAKWLLFRLRRWWPLL